VDRPDDVGRIMMIAEDFYPKVINNITVGGVQQVVLHVQVMEVSRTRLRAMGVDWASFNGDDFVISSVSGLISAVTGNAITSSGGETFSVGFVSGDTSFFGFLEWLRQNNLLKVLAEPKLVTVSGRPAFFNVGGEFPILVPQSLGTVSIEYKKFGTQVDFVPIVLGNGAIRLEVRPRVSEIDNTRSVTINNVTVPGLRVREIDTGAEMRAGQTLAIAGLVQTRVESETKGIPWISELPYVGVPFRRVQEAANEIELLILITPQLIEAMDPGEVPPCGPGMMTDSPDDCELFLKGYLEVPRCCPDGGQGPFGSASGYPHQDGRLLLPPGAEEVPPPEAVPAEDSDRVMLRGRPTRLPRPDQAGSSGPRTEDPPSAARQTTRRRREATPSSSPDNRSQATSPRRSRPAERSQGQPGFIGDTGYDVE
jgi:pilus assembly protein CpaC